MTNRHCSVQFLLPFYGDPSYLQETVESLLAQTDNDWTLLVLDDCYPEPGVERWFASLKDSRIRYTRNDHQLGANGNYRRAIAMSEAGRIVMLGADDRLLPNYLSRCRELLSEADPDVIHPGVRVIDSGGRIVTPLVDRAKAWIRPRVVGSAGLFAGESAAHTLMHGNWTYFPGIMWRRSLVVDTGIRDFHVVQDLALLVDLLMAGATLMVDSEVTFEYRRHAGSDSSVKALTGARFDEERSYYTAVARELNALGWRKAGRAARTRWTSRAHALALMPTAVRRHMSPAPLVRHAFTGWFGS